MLFAATYNPCDPNPCINGGFCTADSTNAFACDCTNGFTGDRCQDGEL